MNKHPTPSFFQKNGSSIKFEDLIAQEDWNKEKSPEEVLDYTLSIGHNSFYVGYSGGKDSGIVLDLIANKYAHFFKGVIYVDTGIGTDATKNFVIDFCKEKNYTLHILSPNDVKAAGRGNLAEGEPFNYENLVKVFGFPKKSFHNNTMAWLKYYPIREFIDSRWRMGEKPAVISGVRKNESARRKFASKYTANPLDRMESIIFVKPLYYKTNNWVSEYWIKTGMKKSPVYETLHISGDCLCGCFADSKELKLIEMFHPEVFKKIKLLEKLIKKEGTKHAQKNNTWGNGSFSTGDIQNQQTLDESLICNDCINDRENTAADSQRFDNELKDIEEKLNHLSSKS